MGEKSEQIKQNKTKWKLIENNMVIIRGEGGSGEVKERRDNGDRRKLDLGNKHTIQYTNYVSYNCTSQTHIILLTNVTQ